MDAVTQKHDYGCGIACVAFVTSRKYESVIHEIDIAKATNAGFYCRELVGLLFQLGHNYKWNFVTNKIHESGVREGSIVYLKRSKQYPAGHYFAKSKSGWMDPWINFSETRDIKKATSGFVNVLPYRASYVIWSNS